MHFCLGCITDHQKPNHKADFLQLLISLIVVISAPFVFSFFNQGSLSQFRDNSPYKKYSQNVDYIIAQVQSAKVESIDSDTLTKNKITNQRLVLNLQSGSERGKTIEQKVQTDAIDIKQQYAVGDKVIVRSESSAVTAGERYYYVMDRYRVSNLIWLCLLFLVLVVALAGTKGLSSTLGLVFSVIVIVQLLIPGILAGAELLQLTMWTSLLILTFTLYLGHGFNRKTTICLVASLITIAISTLLAIWAVDWTSLSGYGNEDVFHLKASGYTGGINLRGLLLSGMIIGSIGVLDDATTAQAVAIEEISKANPNLTRWELFWRGMTIGKEHVVSLVNTLAIAYVGSSMPVLLTFSAFNFSPFWVMINDQTISEEIVRSIVGSTCLLLAIPASNALSAIFLKREPTPTQKPIFSFEDIITKK